MTNDLNVSFKQGWYDAVPIASESGDAWLEPSSAVARRRCEIYKPVRGKAS